MDIRTCFGLSICASFISVICSVKGAQFLKIKTISQPAVTCVVVSAFETKYSRMDQVNFFSSNFFAPGLVAYCVDVFIIFFPYLLPRFLAKNKKSSHFIQIISSVLIEYLLICIFYMHYIFRTNFLL